MTTVMRIIKTKNSVSKNFIFLDGEIKSTGNPNVSMSVSLSMPKDEADDSTEDLNIDLGVNKELTCEWKLYTEDTDRSEGTNATQVKTFGEMLDFLEYNIFFPGIGTVEYQVEITDKFRTRTDLYSFEDFNIDVNSGIYPTGNFKLKWKKRVV